MAEGNNGLVQRGLDDRIVMQLDADQVLGDDREPQRFMTFTVAEIIQLSVGMMAIGAGGGVCFTVLLGI